MSLMLRSLLQRNVAIRQLAKVQQSTLKASLSNSVKQNVGALLRKESANIVNKRCLSAGHDHSKVWAVERAVSVGLLGVIPAAFLCNCSALDYALALSLVAHVHWGLEAIVIDYLRPSVVGAVLSKASLGGLYVLSVVALAGLFYLNYSDVGLSTAVKMMAKI